MTEIFNEISLLLCVYMSILFSGLVPSPHQRYEIGWFFIGVVSLTLIVNWIVMAVVAFIEVYNLLSLWHAESVAKKGPAYLTSTHNPIVFDELNTIGEAGDGAGEKLFEERKYNSK